MGNGVWMLDKFDNLFEEPKQPTESIEPIVLSNTEIEKESIKETQACCDRNTFVGMVSRRRSAIENYNFMAFYHIAAMNNWKDIVIEPKNICDKLNISPMCGVLGSNKDLEWVKSIGLKVEYHNTNIHKYETPTLKILYDWSKQNPNGRVLYFHTKGASAPQIIGKKYWRWLMNEQVIVNYKDNLKRLDIADILGVSWMNGWYAHFAGNFWMARCDWINTLEDPMDHQERNGPYVGGNPWKRMSAELWLGSKPYHHVDSLCGMGLCMYCEENSLYDKYRNMKHFEI